MPHIEEWGVYIHVEEDKLMSSGSIRAELRRNAWNLLKEERKKLEDIQTVFDRDLSTFSVLSFLMALYGLVLLFGAGIENVGIDYKEFRDVLIWYAGLSSVVMLLSFGLLYKEREKYELFIKRLGSGLSVLFYLFLLVASCFPSVLSVPDFGGEWVVQASCFLIVFPYIFYGLKYLFFRWKFGRKRMKKFNDKNALNSLNRHTKKGTHNYCFRFFSAEK